MKTKRYFVKILILFFLIACSSKESDTKNINDDRIRDKKEQSIDWIIGEWLIYSKFSNINVIHCNACPTIKFTKNKKGELTYPNQEKESYTWSIKNDQLYLSLKSGIEEERHFREDIYQIEFENDSSDKELIKLYSSKKTGFNLGKSTNPE